jgi:hypothetical protein
MNMENKEVRVFTDSEYLRGMAEVSEREIGHTPEGRAHARRLHDIADALDGSVLHESIAKRLEKASMEVKDYDLGVQMRAAASALRGMERRLSEERNRRIEQAECTLCAAVESPGFFTGCMIRDDPTFDNREGWICDGRGHLARLVPLPEAPKEERK